MEQSAPQVVTVNSLGELRPLVSSFVRHLKAGNKSEQTITAYRYAAEGLAQFLAERGMPTQVDRIAREHVESYIADLLDRRSPATAHNRYRGLQSFFKWAVEEGEVARSPMEKMKPPILPGKPVPVVP